MSDLTDLYGEDDTGTSKQKVTTRNRAAKPTERIEQTRGRRRSINDPQLKLAVMNQIPGYHLCWVNDESNRIAFHQEAGYDFVTKDEVGLTRTTPVPTNNDVGSRVRQWVGTAQNGEPIYAFLMKIPEGWHKEDLMEPHNRSQEILRAIQKGNVAPNVQGASERVENAYVPQGGIQMNDSLAHRER